MGHADRACFDLQAHSKAANVNLVAQKRLKEPKKIQTVEAVPNKGVLGKSFKQSAKEIISALAELSLSEEKVLGVEKSLKEKG